MAKDKLKASKAAPNRHLVARTAFLQRASIYVTSLRAPPTLSPTATSDHTEVAAASLPLPFTKESNVSDTSQAMAHPQPPVSGLPFILSTQLKQVALRSQTRLLAGVKRGMCKMCNAVLIEHQSCRKFVENRSRNRQKERANVLVIECFTCGNRKRFPIGAERQQRKRTRGKSLLQTQLRDSITAQSAVGTDSHDKFSFSQSMG